MRARSVVNDRGRRYHDYYSPPPTPLLPPAPIPPSRARACPLPIACLLYRISGIARGKTAARRSPTSWMPWSSVWRNVKSRLGTPHRWKTWWTVRYSIYIIEYYTVGETDPKRERESCCCCCCFSFGHENASKPCTINTVYTVCV